MSRKTINAKLVKAGYPKVEIERGDGYIYFIFDDGGAHYETQTIPVPYFNIYTVDEWVEMGIDFGNKMNEKVAESGQFGERFRCVSPFASLGNPRREAN